MSTKKPQKAPKQPCGKTSPKPKARLKSTSNLSPKLPQLLNPNESQFNLPKHFVLNPYFLTLSFPVYSITNPSHFVLWGIEAADSQPQGSFQGCQFPTRQGVTGLYRRTRAETDSLGSPFTGAYTRGDRTVVIHFLRRSSLLDPSRIAVSAEHKEICRLRLAQNLERGGQTIEQRDDSSTRLCARTGMLRNTHIAQERFGPHED